jgi:hypothetical protein
LLHRDDRFGAVVASARSCTAGVPRLGREPRSQRGGIQGTLRHAERHLYRGVDAGNNTSCTIQDLATGTTYYFVATAYDSYGYESVYSNEVSYTVTGGDPPPDPPPASGGSSGGGGCFIAIAAFGSYLDPHVAVLRSFRDNFLLTNRLGKAFVSWYYATSPPYADAIRQNGPVKAVVRIALFALIGFAYLCQAAGVVPACLVAVAFLVAFAWGARRPWVRRGATPRCS